MSKYSIILPVRNGGKYVKDCINSILSQTKQDFKLILLDNCSTDGTLQWVQSLEDSRIVIYSASHSLSIEQNWKRVISVPKNEFITMIGHDDVLDENYLSIMDALIDKHPKASLYQAHFRYIDSEGNEIGKCQPMDEIQKPVEAIHNFLCNKTDLMGTGFMMRSHDYDTIGGIPSYPNLLFADMELWIELSRKSFLAVDKHECFSYRRHPVATTTSSSDSRFLQSFEMLVNYLYNLKAKDPELAPVIARDSIQLLKQYCQGISHKVLRTPKKIRQTPSVSDIIDQFREYGKKLAGTSFEPLNYKKILVGKIIDNNSILHSLFLLFKKIYDKPVSK